MRRRQGKHPCSGPPAQASCRPPQEVAVDAGLHAGVGAAGGAKRAGDLRDLPRSATARCSPRTSPSPVRGPYERVTLGGPVRTSACGLSEGRGFAAHRRSVDRAGLLAARRLPLCPICAVAVTPPRRSFSLSFARRVSAYARSRMACRADTSASTPRWIRPATGPGLLHLGRKVPDRHAPGRCVRDNLTRRTLHPTGR
jgi:hypothetical protein